MRTCLSGLAGLFFFSSVSFVYPLESPTLVFEASRSNQATVTRLERIDQSQFRDSLALVGLTQPGDPIRVIVAAEQTEWAHQAPSWASGYALPQRGIIVILPQRVVSYPYDSLENLLFHEVAHIFATRASGGQTLPRWFDEGLAMVAARAWDFEDGARLTWALVAGEPVSLKDLDELFHEDGGSARKAYVLSHALVRFFIQEFGRDWPSNVLAVMSHGQSFREAFFRTTFVSLDKAEATFWANQTMWTRWVPAVTSTVALWIGIVGLALYAFKKQRQRAKTLKRKWQEEDDLNG